MASVIRNYLNLSDAELAFSHVATYTNRSRARALLLFFFACVAVLRCDAHVAHLHVSQRGSFLRAIVLTRALRLRAVPVVMTIHGSRFGDFAQRHPRVTAATLERANVITVLTLEAEKLVSALSPAVPVVRLSNFVTVSTSPTPVPDRPLLLFAGEMTKRKGVDVLLQAVRSVRKDVPDTEVVLAGPAGDVAVPDEDGVTQIGTVPSDRVEELIEASRCGVLPSRAEALPMFVLEVMARGRPVIVSDIHELREILGGGGITVPVGNAEALANALRKVLTDDEWAYEAGLRAWSQARQHFSGSAARRQLRLVYERATRRTP